MGQVKVPVAGKEMNSSEQSLDRSCGRGITLETREPSRPEERRV